MTEFANIELALIAQSLTNPRKNFNPTKLAELAEDIKRRGIDTPITVRPLPGSRVADTDRKVQFELVCGERRLRASELAGVSTIPAIVRALTDDQSLEIQLVENLQRDDLSALEEAEGYQTLMDHSSLTADAVGEKISKSRAYVYARLKLLDLSQEVKQAMRDGDLDFSRALLIARIPDAGLQAKALAEATDKDYQGEIRSVRSFQTWLQANVMLRLDKAVFKITDTRLVQAAGSCTACPKRTGANPDLFADASSADLCIDPACYHGKEEAHRTALVAMAAKKGMKFIEGKEAKELIPHQYTDHIRGYSPLSQVREDCIKDGQTGLTLRELLGSDATGAVLIENPYTKALIEAVPTDEAEGVLLAKGLLRAGDDDEDSDDAQGKPRGMATWTPTQLQARLQNVQIRIDKATTTKTERETLQAAQNAVRAVDDDTAKALISPALLRTFLLSAMDNQTEASMATALGYTFADGEDEQDALVHHIKSTDHANIFRAAAIVLMECENDWTYGDATYPMRDHVCNSLGVNTKAIAKAAAKAALVEQGAELKEIEALIAAKAEPKKDDLPQSPLAQPHLAPGSAKEGAKSKGAKAPTAPRKPKLSPEQAKSGIAAAMQEQERAGTAPPEAQQGETQGTVAVGSVVQVTSDTDKLHLRLHKYAGKTGRVTGKMGDRAWDVSFKGRTGGLASFDVSELTAVAA
jgi:ParB/RepB/Spo0J family partition protein